MSHNSSTRFGQPLHLELRASARLRNAALAAHALVLIVWWWSDLPLAGVLAGSGALILHYRWFHQRHVAAGRRDALQALHWDSARGWRIRTGDGRWRDGVLRTPVFVTRHLALARFRRSRWRSYSAVVVADRLDSDDFRRLRVRLIQSAHGRGDRVQVSGA